MVLTCTPVITTASPRSTLLHSTIKRVPSICSSRLGPTSMSRRMMDLHLSQLPRTPPVAKPCMRYFITERRLTRRRYATASGLLGASRRARCRRGCAAAIGSR
ncbi:unnamed protein product [Ectocarpus sp. 13 AM-2016]